MEHISNNIRAPHDVGRLLAAGRSRAGLTQAQLAEKLGVSRKTVSEIERGAAENVSLKTALRALALVGFVVQATPHRPPQLADVMARRAQDLNRADKLG